MIVRRYLLSLVVAAAMRCMLVTLGIVLLLSVSGVVRAQGVTRVVVAEGEAAQAIRVPQDASPTVRYAASLLQRRIEQLGGLTPRLVEGPTESAGIVLQTGGPLHSPRAGGLPASLAEEAYQTTVVAGAGEPHVVLAGGSDRAVLYGAAWLADLALQTEGARMILTVDEKVHQPALAVRGNYTLACWGKTHLYSRRDWEHVLDAMAGDSMNVVLFWLAGLFPSRQYPEALIYPETKLSVEEVRALIRHAHDRGMRFLLGSGVFAWFGVDAIAEKHPETKAVGAGGMCPSHAEARNINRQYLLEMLDAFPEADGLYLEVRDEYGPCRCATCEERLDQRGSKRYGEAELQFLRELAAEVWQRNPRAVLVTAVGYGSESQGAHADDVLFYEGLRTLNDPRLLWLVVRNHWQWPATAGLQPVGTFSRNLVQWCQYYRLSVAEIADWARRSQQAGCIGFCPALEPGFCTASWYSDEVPYPVDAIPYAITRFAYREFCWEPQLTEDQFRERLRQRFFGPSAPPHLDDDLLTLFDLIRTESQNGRLAPHGRWSRGEVLREVEQLERALSAAEADQGKTPVPTTKLRELDRVQQRCGDRLRQIEQRLDQAEASLSPRGRQTALLMRRAVADSRAELGLSPEWELRVKRVLDRAEQVAELRRKNCPATAVATSQYNDTTYEAYRAIDGDPKTSWLCVDRAPLPQTLTLTLREPRRIDYVTLTQGAYHPAYNTRAYRVEYSPDGQNFLPLFSGELGERSGDVAQRRFTPVEARAVRIVIDSVYPAVDYSSPSLAEVDVGLGERSQLLP